MKRIFVLLMVALMSAVTVNAKTVRGYVSDKEGNPVVGMKMVVVNADRDRTVPKEGKGIGTEVMSGHGASE